MIHADWERGTWISLGDPVVTEIVSEMGFGWLLFDLEHGSFSEPALIPNFQAVRDPRTRLITRIPDPHPAQVGKVLDAGAHGLMVPHVSTAACAEQVVDAMLYPPRGSRGFSTSVRAMGYGFRAVKDTLAAEPPVLMVQIEDREGVRNSADIARVEGVDVLFVGPRDLGLDLAVHPGEMTFDEALATVAGNARAAGKRAGILVRNPADKPRLAGMGFDVFASGSDLGALKEGYKPYLP